MRAQCRERLGKTEPTWRKVHRVEAERSTSHYCNAKGSQMMPWFQGGNSKIRKERAQVREVAKVATQLWGPPVAGRDCRVKTDASFSSHQIPAAHIQAAWLCQAAAKNTCVCPSLLPGPERPGAWVPRCRPRGGAERA